MDDQLETILNDLFALDSTLKEEEDQVREIVKLLLEKRPVISPDAAFASELRRQLLTSGSTSALANAPTLGLPWFMVYAVPVGVAAVFILMLLPQQTSHIPPSTLAPTSLPEMDTRMAPDESMNAKMMAPESEAGEAVMDTMMQFSLPAEPTDSFALAVDGEAVIVEFVSVSAPSYLLIETILENGKPGEVIGISSLLLPTDASAATIHLKRSLVSNTTYLATLYRDDGDGVFVAGVDQVAYDASGTLPLQQFFSTSPDETLIPQL